MNKFEQQLSATQYAQSQIERISECFQLQKKKLDQHLILSRFIKLQSKLLCNHEIAAADLLEHVITDYKASF